MSFQVESPTFSFDLSTNGKRGRDGYEDSLTGESPVSSIQKVSKRLWKGPEVDALKKAVEKLGTRSWKAIERDLKSQGVDRTGKQARERYRNHLDPKSLGTIIQDSHKITIGRLSYEHPRQWKVIRDLFAKTQPGGEYYPENTIKNCILQEYKNLQIAPPASKGRPSQIRTAQEIFRRVWDDSEKEALRKAVENLGTGSWKAIESDLNSQGINRTRKQAREKWDNELDPKSLGRRIQKDHRDLIDQLYAEHPRKWKEIRRLFAARQSDGEYYSDNTIKNYILGKEARLKSNGVITSSADFEDLMLIESKDWDVESIFSEDIA